MLVGKRLSKELADELGVRIFRDNASSYRIKKVGNKIIFKIFIWDDTNNEYSANITHSFRIKVFDEECKITMILETDGEFSLNDLINYFNKFELFIRNNIEKIEFEETESYTEGKYSL